MADHVTADHVLPMHHSTFKLSYEPTHEPIERLMEAAGGSANRIVAHEVGMTWTR
jgi:L-ascorbate metabolism protein UlaG (beta-lactamase superfamily)